MSRNTATRASTALSLFAAILAVPLELSLRHRRTRGPWYRGRFTSFLKEIDRAPPQDVELHLVLDNYATHKHPDVNVWLNARNEKQIRFALHFVPTSCSWLNLVERFFAQITTKRIRRGTFSSIKELEVEIRDHFRIHNKDPKPFKWTASAEAIIEKIAQCRKTYETLH